MILVDIKAESVAPSLLGSANLKDEKPTLSFSELLRGAKTTKDEQGVQNGSFVVALGGGEKDVKTLKDVKLISSKDTLSSLLKNSDEKTVLTEDIKPLELNPKITQNLSVVELKTLIADAKQFLKDKILQSVEYKKSEVKDLPKTLKGLTQMAKTFGIDMSKITLEEVRGSTKGLEVAVKQENKSILKTDVKPVHAEKTDIKPMHAEKTDVKAVPAEKTDVKAVPAEKTDVKAVSAEKTDVKAVSAEKTDVKAVPA
ncbi:MAG: flagellar hook-length control protein FliK, partial [Sulfurimonas sp.]